MTDRDSRDSPADIEFRVSPAVDDRALSRLHHEAFGSDSDAVHPWSEQLAGHSILWITAEDGGELVGFVNVVGDGGAHAFLLDTIVAPARQGEGIGRRLVELAAARAREAGCQWLHVDFEDDLSAFYFEQCGFRPTAAGLRRLS